MRALLLSLLLFSSPALAQAQPSPVQSGQVWILAGVTADGEQFRSVLRLTREAPKGQPWTYRADRGSLLYDASVPSLVALDTVEAKAGGLALACVSLSPAKGQTSWPGVLVSGGLAQVSARLGDAFGVASVARTPTDLKAAAAELRLGTCTLTRR
ncbi:hypothetical protein [Deinococcus hopiensis]|uniref:Uncharacterized protein n=1 Tax=Deinococcus hopiensis KR-140 TaxID=695939 RepID=A0A1W1VQP9_9DEIO|nr:hypothetical protein [Deinococcus hopiensis]SMB95411.1 hypothetical protein SAMN00790413_02823 [Deinococcus hopiensis KR-140]